MPARSKRARALASWAVLRDRVERAKGTFQTHGRRVVVAVAPTAIGYAVEQHYGVSFGAVTGAIFGVYASRLTVAADITNRLADEYNVSPTNVVTGKVCQWLSLPAPLPVCVEYSALPDLTKFTRYAALIHAALAQDTPDLVKAGRDLDEANRTLFPEKVQTMQANPKGKGHSDADEQDTQGHVKALRELVVRRLAAAAQGDAAGVRPGDEQDGRRVTHVSRPVTWKNPDGELQTTFWAMASLPQAVVTPSEGGRVLRPELVYAARETARFRLTAGGASVLEQRRGLFPAEARADALLFTVTTSQLGEQYGVVASQLRAVSMCKYVLRPEGAEMRDDFFDAAARGQFWLRTTSFERGRVPGVESARLCRRRLLDLAHTHVVCVAPQ